MEYLVGIDIGTSSTKAVAFSTKGAFLLKKSVPYPIESPRQEFKEQNCELLFEAVLTTLKELVRALDGKLLGISFSSVLHSIIAVDEKGNPLTNCLIWADNRSRDYAFKLKGSDLGTAIYKNTGTPIHPMTPLCKIAWIRDRQPEIFRRTVKFISIKEYILFHLFGAFLVDYSVASATAMFDNSNLEWFAPALHFAGIEVHHLSKPVPPTFLLPALKKEFADYLKISPKTPFIIGAGDGCLANLGALALKEGEAVVTIGTSAAVRMTSTKVIYDEQERLFNYLLTEKIFVSGGATNNGGIVYQWFLKQFYEKNLSKKEILKKAKDLEKIPPGSEGLLFLPYLTGERAPLWDADAKGIFFGISSQHTKAHFHRAVLEGILFNIFQIGQALEEAAGKMERIYANGGLAQMDFMMQMMADIFGKEVFILETEEASAFGAAILGMKALNLIDTFEEARTMIKIQKTVVPNKEKHSVYQQYFDIFRGLYPKLKADFDKIATLGVR